MPNTKHATRIPGARNTCSDSQAKLGAYCLNTLAAVACIRVRLHSPTDLTNHECPQFSVALATLAEGVPQVSKNGEWQRSRLLASTNSCDLFWRQACGQPKALTPAVGEPGAPAL